MTFQKYIENKLKDKASEGTKTVLFIDGQDPRAQKAAVAHEMDGILKPLLLFEKRSDYKEGKPQNLLFMEDWADKQDILVAKYLEKRKGKETEEQAREAVKDKINFAMLMIELGEVDGAIGGLIDPTANILRGAFKIVGTKPGIKTISSVMLMERGNEWYIFTDISVNIEPNTQQLVEIAKNASDFAKAIDFKTKVAFLSFSTSGSAVHPASQAVREATVAFNETYDPKYKAIGEVQFDAAFSAEVRRSKYKDEGFKKNPTIFVFPSLNAGNIGYKIAQRMGGFGAIGPIITGVNKPVNDLSRGATTDDVYNTALITALQAYE